MKYLTKHNHLFSNQHGFQQGRSCETQLFELVSDIYEAVNDSSQIDAIFIDFAKAFDKLTHYLINDSVIARAHTIKYLGVHLSSNISWSDHIEAICSSACKTLGFIRRNLYLANKSTKLLAYATLVRAKLEYASFIWNPHQSYLINKLEAIQNKATRFITKDYSRTSSITNLKKSLNLSTLENRRIIALLSHFHKLYHSSSSFRVRHITAAHRIFPRLDHPFKVQPVFARTNFLSKSPLFLAIYHWNKLPADVVSSQNHEDFMNKLKSYFNES
nr:uncharacterized protein LOC119186713 [Rhipicephalus microplus]